MRIEVTGRLGHGLTAKDLALEIVNLMGISGGSGYALEFAGPVIAGLTMDARMPLCNMAIEAGARVGMIGVDETTIDYLRGRPGVPKDEQWDAAVNHWRTLVSNQDAAFDDTLTINAGQIGPRVTWGSSPNMSCSVLEHVPDPEIIVGATQRRAAEKALRYMGLKAGTAITDIYLDKIFIGSCTNARLEDLRLAASIIRGKHIAANITQALVVPGSGLVKQAAEKEGLDQIFRQAGFEWRDAGCSMYLGMNEDQLKPGERCASTSNRNFEGRQGFGGRSHLVSPAMASAAAIAGHFVDVRECGLAS